MHRFAMMRFSNGDPETSGITQASQRRYVHYFNDMIEHRVDMKFRPLALTRVVMRGGIPNYDKHGGVHPVLYIYRVSGIALVLAFSIHCFSNRNQSKFTCLRALIHTTGPTKR